eukprot:CAMPEP_0204532472 /NCGR_PEP_ID=MMETSP0661-20131031/11744_1 /ASSEMBLY_ACC=CAM_ASM_000606 /TAXON_ID=109239 /ORGANISM="Alexandrium margalefi, Strain AMGDE01CS-322" /LENGTH=206 /DNA_ID=CAMNT_0051538717 /DNA_START=100 /DNA_END=717 /DNA_ORIENTATION=-
MASAAAIRLAAALLCCLALGSFGDSCLDEEPDMTFSKGLPHKSSSLLQRVSSSDAGGGKSRRFSVVGQESLKEASLSSQASLVNPTKISPFGKEDTSTELQRHAARTQDTLVDAVENAEVAEIKRAVFRSLTRLRAAEIKEFDTIARLETQAIDEYNDAHHYRKENPLDYISSSEPKVKEDKYTSSTAEPWAPALRGRGSTRARAR